MITCQDQIVAQITIYINTLFDARSIITKTNISQCLKFPKYTQPIIILQPTANTKRIRRTCSRRVLTSVYPNYPPCRRGDTPPAISRTIRAIQSTKVFDPAGIELQDAQDALLARGQEGERKRHEVFEVKGTGDGSSRSWSGHRSRQRSEGGRERRLRGSVDGVFRGPPSLWLRQHVSVAGSESFRPATRYFKWPLGRSVAIVPR